MEVVQSSEHELVIRDRPWLFGGMLWLMGLAALYAAITGKIEDQGTDPELLRLFVGALGLGACGFAWWAFPFQTFRFDRLRGLFTRRKVRLLHVSEEQLPLAMVEKAMIQSNWSDDTRLERLALVANGAPLPLEVGYGGAGRTGMAETINGWLAQGARR